MKQKEVFKKIGGIINELSEQYEYLQTVVDNLNDLELELFVSNAHFLTDHIEILRKLNLQNKPKYPVTEKPETSNQQKFFEPVVQQMKPASYDPKELKISTDEVIPLVTELSNTPIPTKNEESPEEPAAEGTTPQFDFTSQAPEDSYSFIREEPETIRHELILDEVDNWEDDENVEFEVEDTVVGNDEQQQPAPVTEAPAVQETAAIIDEPSPAPAAAADGKAGDKETDEQQKVLTINQKISSQLADKTAVKTEPAISDLKAAITLNDKLLFVKDLFNGYNLAYSEAIEILNRFNSFDEAERFLKTNYVIKNNWEGKPATSQKFYALLKRRYA